MNAPSTPQGSEGRLLTVRACLDGPTVCFDHEIVAVLPNYEAAIDAWNAGKSALAMLAACLATAPKEAI